MENNEFIRQYLSDFELVCLVDLYDISTSPGAAYKLLQSVHQKSYTNNQRLVFYSQHDVPAGLLEHLYNAAYDIDISNYFVVIACPNATDVIKQTEKISPGTVLFTGIDVKVKSMPLDNQYTLSNTVCPLLWEHLQINQRGEIAPCCVYKEKIGSFLETDESLEDVFYNNNMNVLRERMLNGERLVGCQKCWNTEDRGLTSFRQMHLSFKKNTLLTKTLDNPKLSSLDLIVGNTCNFKCRICNSENSSLYAAEEKKFKNPNKRLFNNDYIPMLFQELKTLVIKRQITNIDFYGGEPFYTKDVINFVDWTVNNQHSKQLRLHFNTNGSIFPEKLKNHWQHFNNVDIQFSIDNIGEQFELERGGSWIDVENNIKSFINLKLPNMTLGIMPVVSIMNILNLDTVINWAEDLGLSVQFNLLYAPNAFSILNLTPKARDLCINKHINSKHKYLQDLVNDLRKIPTSDGTEFCKTIKYFDKIRNQDFRKTHYDIANAMNLC